MKKFIFSFVILFIGLPISLCAEFKSGEIAARVSQIKVILESYKSFFSDENLNAESKKKFNDFLTYHLQDLAQLSVDADTVSARKKLQEKQHYFAKLTRSHRSVITLLTKQGDELTEYKQLINGLSQAEKERIDKAIHAVALIQLISLMKQMYKGRSLTQQEADPFDSSIITTTLNTALTLVKQMHQQGFISRQMNKVIGAARGVQSLQSIFGSFFRGKAVKQPERVVYRDAVQHEPVYYEVEREVITQSEVHPEGNENDEQEMKTAEQHHDGEQEVVQEKPTGNNQHEGQQFVLKQVEPVHDRSFEQDSALQANHNHEHMYQAQDNTFDNDRSRSSLPQGANHSYWMNVDQPVHDGTQMSGPVIPPIPVPEQDNEQDMQTDQTEEAGSDDDFQHQEGTQGDATDQHDDQPNEDEEEEEDEDDEDEKVENNQNDDEEKRKLLAEKLRKKYAEFKKSTLIQNPSNKTE